jgi:5-methyltetrahydropteroyltriglutamate--homocysteine methyltransferase
VDAYLAELVDILRDEVSGLIRLGCTYVQIDSPRDTALLDPDLREGYRQRGNNPDRLLDLSIEMDNAVIADHPGIIFGLHLCRGNNQSKFYAAGDYGPITKVFRNTRFQRFLLEYDDERRAVSSRFGRCLRIARLFSAS